MNPKLAGRIRELKGAPLSVALLLTLNPAPASQDWLERASGYTDKPIQQACRYLQEQGLAEKTSAGWILTNQIDPDSVWGAPIVEPGENFPDQSPSNSSEVNDLKDLKNINTNTTNLLDDRNISDAADKPEVWKELYRIGLRRNSRTIAMVALEHITREYVLAMELKFKAQNRDCGKNSGLFIIALENHDPIDSSFFQQLDNNDYFFKRGKYAPQPVGDPDEEYDDETEGDDEEYQDEEDWDPTEFSQEDYDDEDDEDDYDDEDDEDD